MGINELLVKIEQSANVGIVLGAGISCNVGIPSGYRLMMDFATQHQALMKKYQLFESFQKIKKSKDGGAEANFVDMLVKVFQSERVLQETLLSWLMSHPKMMGVQSDDHAIFIIAWLRRVFRHLVTTNWDFLLEWQVESIYDIAYSEDPFQPIKLILSNGAICNVNAEQLFFPEHLNGDDYAWNPRWEIVSNEYDLLVLKRWIRPIWKIHGSPFLLSCPQCRGIDRWKRVEDLHFGDSCPQHSEEKLLPEIVLWSQGIDKVDFKVWKSLKKRLQRCDLIIVVGHSGQDTYIRETIERFPNVYVINQDNGQWDIDQIHFIKAYASDLTHGLLKYFLID